MLHIGLNLKLNNNMAQRKLQQALLGIGHQVERNPTIPTVSDIEILFDKFLQAVDTGDMIAQRKAVNELCAGVVRWEINKL